MARSGIRHAEAWTHPPSVCCIRTWIRSRAWARTIRMARRAIRISCRLQRPEPRGNLHSPPRRGGWRDSFIEAGAPSSARIRPARPTMRFARENSKRSEHAKLKVRIQQTISIREGVAASSAFRNAGLNSLGCSTRKPSAPKDSAKRTKSGLTRCTAMRRPS